MAHDRDRFGLVIADKPKNPAGPALRAGRQWEDSVEVTASLGNYGIGCRVFPDDMRALASWLSSEADAIEAGL